MGGGDEPCISVAGKLWGECKMDSDSDRTRGGPDEVPRLSISQNYVSTHRSIQQRLFGKWIM